MCKEQCMHSTYLAVNHFPVVALYGKGLPSMSVLLGLGVMIPGGAFSGKCHAHQPALAQNHLMSSVALDSSFRLRGVTWS